jgi:hypothetical protein
MTIALLFVHSADSITARPASRGSYTTAGVQGGSSY